MLNQVSFSEILEQVENYNNRQVNGFGFEWESHQEPLGLDQITQLVRKAHSNSCNLTKELKKAYPVKPQVKVILVRPSHQLNETQSIAFSVLKLHSPTIKDNFNLHELKSAYRLSVLKTHPDQGGDSETFQEVKKSYQILLALVKN